MKRLAAIVNLLIKGGGGTPPPWSWIVIHLEGMLIALRGLGGFIPAGVPGGEIGNWNTGGPRSRIVSCPVQAQALSKDSVVLGTKCTGRFGLHPQRHQEGLRGLVAGVLEALGFASPEEAWEAMEDELPSGTRIVIDDDERSPGRRTQDLRELLRHALVLGKCCGSLFRPERPLIWSERRLKRTVRLVFCDPETFTRDEDE